MKKAIFTLAIGDNPMYKAALHSFKLYAQKVGADLIVSDQLHYKIDIVNPKFNASPAWTEKLRIGELLNEYDRVLYVDSDIIIRPDARDIFELYQELDTTYWLNEGLLKDRQADISLICDKLGPVEWATESGMPTYYNAGVILTSKEAGLFSITNLEDLQLLCNEVSFYEQSYFNYCLHKYGFKHQRIDKAFNHMDMFGNGSYLDADFIHYAGKGYAKTSRRRDVQFLKDFSAIFDGIVSADELKKLKEDAWQAYLKVIYKKYPLPNILIKLFTEHFVPR
ncbi:glycosyltransferase family 8 protein [Pseudoalteromonas luteoviolacea]|uniref:glycosyltransferase family 8 protein n=1 Tax=Pseudoalteromonas luteoviolacea TaxID=43657 RepID=UPI001B39FA30|nr:glycosyltransferase family 8 protein [Pseudoalteromonas luteoviolacea]MBQ4879078.1 glycosyltransferase family 8 protein [Pseudoalteromonas luteoviolacea]MBQ4908167.1 glycosyltransferase family 8 protein [Pseudoalteromonas luteoviolacea]